jgi:hypothetical protein
MRRHRSRKVLRGVESAFPFPSLVLLAALSISVRTSVRKAIAYRLHVSEASNGLSVPFDKGTRQEGRGLRGTAVFSILGQLRKKVEVPFDWRSAQTYLDPANVVQNIDCYFDATPYTSL